MYVWKIMHVSDDKQFNSFFLKKELQLYFIRFFFFIIVEYAILHLTTQSRLSLQFALKYEQQVR